MTKHKTRITAVEMRCMRQTVKYTHVD